MSKLTCILGTAIDKRDYKLVNLHQKPFVYSLIPVYNNSLQPYKLGNEVIFSSILYYHLFFNLYNMIFLNPKQVFNFFGKKYLF